MTREQVMNSMELKKRFCKDCGFPIAVYDNPYFEDRLKTLDPYFGCVRKFEIFVNEMALYSNAQDYFAYYNGVKDAVINAIQTNDAFISFNGYDFDVNSDLQNRNLYSAENDGCQFISIDMRQANFSALHTYDPAIFLNENSWEEYISNYTDSVHIIGSKYIRQVILGACNPRRQTRYEKKIMSDLWNHLKETIPSIEYYSFDTDEIIIKIDNPTDYSLTDLREAIDAFHGDFRVRRFELDGIPGTSGWCKFYDSDRDFELKCLGADIFHVVLKYFYEQPITPRDLVFSYNGTLAKFLEPIPNPFEE